MEELPSNVRIFRKENLEVKIILSMPLEQLESAEEAAEKRYVPEERSTVFPVDWIQKGEEWHGELRLYEHKIPKDVDGYIASIKKIGDDMIFQFYKKPYMVKI